MSKPPESPIWRTLEDADGTIVAHGYTTFDPKEGQKVKEYAYADKSVVATMRKRKRISPRRQKLLDIDLEDVTDDYLKIVIRVLQEKFS